MIHATFSPRGLSRDSAQLFEALLKYSVNIYVFTLTAWTEKLLMSLEKTKTQKTANRLYGGGP